MLITVLLVLMLMSTLLIRMYYCLSVLLILCPYISNYSSSGILTTHVDFGVRATAVFNAIPGEGPVDLNGHGTHVRLTLPSISLSLPPSYLRAIVNFFLVRGNDWRNSVWSSQAGLFESCEGFERLWQWIYRGCRIWC